MANNIVEALIGTMVLILAGFFLAYAYSTADLGHGANGYQLKARFDRVDGLVVGSDVRMSGIKIGTVSSQRLDTDTFMAEVTLSIDSEIAIPDDSSAKITTDGLLGDTYISLEAGGSFDTLEDGGEIEYTQGSIDLMGLIGQAIFSVGGGGEEKADPSPAQ